MDEKRIFVIYAMALICSVVLWYVFLYQPRLVQSHKLELQVNEIISELNTANHASVDIRNIEDRLAEEEESLKLIKKRFIDRDDLSRATKVIQSLARQYNLQLTDFAPVMGNYFADTTGAKINPLLLTITVSGSYINIGKFIEDWESLPLYMAAEEIAIKKQKSNSNILTATIGGTLYTLKVQYD